MRFALIGDSREWSEGSFVQREVRQIVQPDDLEREARRRKYALRLDEWQLREFVSGTPLPEHIVQMCQQIDFAAAALARMSPIPADYADDLYWPRVW